MITTGLPGAVCGLSSMEASRAIRFVELDVDRDDTLAMTDAGCCQKSLSCSAYWIVMTMAG